MGNTLQFISDLPDLCSFKLIDIMTAASTNEVIILKGSFRIVSLETAVPKKSFAMMDVYSRNYTKNS